MLVCNMINVNKIVDWLKQSSDWTSQLNRYSKVLDNSSIHSSEFSQNEK